MTLEKLEAAKHLFLIFPAGCGGNHLANLLSLDPVFAPRYKINPNRYFSNMVKDYLIKFASATPGANAVAHFSALENLQLDLLEPETQNILDSSGIYIFCSHAFEFTIRNQSKKLEKFNNKIFLLFSVPTGKNKLVKSRMDNGLWSKGEHVDMIIDGGKMKVDDLYDPKTFCRKNYISMDQVVLIDTDRFYSIEGYDYMHDLIYENFNITLHPFCRELHTVYMKYAEAGYSNS